MSTTNNKKFTTVGSVNRTKNGERTYVRVIKDIKAGSMLSVVDPRDKLTDEQKAELEANGQVTIQTKTGKSFTLYNSTQFELRLAE